MRRIPTLSTIVVLALILALVAGLSVQLPRGEAHAQDPGRGTAPQQAAAPQAALGTGFTYQGHLSDGGSPADGEYDLMFVLHSHPTDWSPVSAIDYEDDTSIEQGLFTVRLDFGADRFKGEARYLEIGVRPGDSAGAYTTLAPRQELTPAPYALALPGLWIQQNATSPNVIGGHTSNTVPSGVFGAVIGGGGSAGYPNEVRARYATIGGGWRNQSGDESAYATISGGKENRIGNNNYCATVGGGDRNKIGDDSSFATIGGGRNNLITDTASYATIPGGYGNEASGWYSFAAGRRAKATHQGSFVLADSTDADFASVRDDALRVRFNGGATFLVNNGQWVRLWVNEGTDPDHLIDTSAGGDPGAHLTIGGDWTNASDRDAKENFAPVDTQAILDRVAEMPVQTWNYKVEGPSVLRMGPTAQDFHAAFGLGEDDLHISTIDADGVALAAIQGLYEQNHELAAENAALQSRVDNLEARLTALERGGVARSSAFGLLSWPLLGGLVLVGGLVLRRRRAGGER